jgi:hypothetical protein
MTEPTFQLLDIVSCIPGPAGTNPKTGKDWALYYLEVADAAGNPLDGKYKCWNNPLPIGTGEYYVEVQDSAQYGRSYTLKPARSGQTALPKQEPLPESQPAPETYTSSEGEGQKPIYSGTGEMITGTTAQAITALARRIDKLDERLTVLAKLYESKAVPVGQSKFEDDDDIPF